MAPTRSSKKTTKSSVGNKKKGSKRVPLPSKPVKITKPPGYEYNKKVALSAAKLAGFSTTGQFPAASNKGLLRLSEKGRKDYERKSIMNLTIQEVHDNLFPADAGKVPKVKDFPAMLLEWKKKNKSADLLKQSEVFKEKQCGLWARHRSMETLFWHNRKEMCKLLIDAGLVTKTTVRQAEAEAEVTL